MSNTWKGILKAIPTLEKGRGKLIRSGANTLFWGDKWVGHCPLVEKATSLVQLQDRYRTVQSYWDNSTGWKWDQFDELLPVSSLEEIAAMIVDNDTATEDLLIWRYGEARDFSVSSAYDIVCNRPVSTEAAKWNAIWKLRIPSRAKTFLWLARHEKLLTNEARARRGMTTDSNCGVCSNRTEDIDHVLRICPLADVVWSRLLPKFHTDSRCLNFREWLDRGINSKGSRNRPENDNILFSLTVWWIWKWRNELVFNNSPHTLNAKIAWIRSQVAEVITAFEKGPNRLHSINSYKWEMCRWSRPEEDRIKVNFDGSVDLASGKASCGGVIRDSQGEWKGGFLCNIGACPPLQAEAWALFRSIQLAVHQGFKKVTFEGDSKELARILLEGHTNERAVCNLTRACRLGLRQLEDWRINIVPREANTSADGLARLARTYPKGMYILWFPPDHIHNLLESDRAGLPHWRLAYDSC